MDIEQKLLNAQELQDLYWRLTALQQVQNAIRNNGNLGEEYEPLKLKYVKRVKQNNFSPFSQDAPICEIPIEVGLSYIQRRIAEVKSRIDAITID